MSVDVAARLAEGAEAVRAIETYVAASCAIGRARGPLTVTGVREAYTAEAGMRLDALEADSVALGGLAGAVEEGVRLEGEALEAVLRSWQGVAGTAAAEFVERHLANGTAVAASLRAASGALRSLREELGSLVDQKVAAAVRFDDRWAAAHPVWLAEAETVLNGLADDVAIQVVAQQISPYLDRDVRSDWIPAMSDATGSVATAYDGAVARLADRPLPQFSSPATGSVAGQVSESMWASSPTPAAPVWGSAAAPLWGSAAPQLAQWTPGLSSGASPAPLGIGGVGGGLPALIGRIVEALGSYSGPTNLGIVDDPKTLRELEAEKDISGQTEEADPETDAELATGELDPSLEKPLPPTPITPAAPMPPPITPADTQPIGGAPVSQPLPTQPTAPPEPTGLVQPTPPSAPLAAEARSDPVTVDTTRSNPEPKTPCSIAMDELPQVGQ